MSDKEYKQLSKKDRLPLKYACVQPDVKKYMLTFEKEVPQVLWNHIQNLYELIDYQMKKQLHQEQQIIAIKHLEAWKRYDRPLEHYNEKERRYFTEEEIKARKC